MNETKKDKNIEGRKKERKEDGSK